MPRAQEPAGPRALRTHSSHRVPSTPAPPGRRLLAAALLLAALGCGTATGTDTPAGATATTVRILSYAFSPQRVTATPGSSVLVLNLDPFEHDVTSEAAPSDSGPAGSAGGIEFASPPFTSSWVIQVPSTAVPGTIVYYYCRLHAAANPNHGEIEVVAP